MRLLHEIAIFQTVKSKMIISLSETVRLSVSISLRNLYNSLNSMKEISIFFPPFFQRLTTFATSYLLPYREQILSIKSSLSYAEGRLGRVAQSVGHLTCKSEVLGSIPGLATCFRFSFRLFKRGSCQLMAKVCAQSTG